MLDVGVVGEGAFGTVNKMVHKESNTHMAVKVRFFSSKFPRLFSFEIFQRVHVTVDESEMKRLNMDLDVIRKSNCAYIVKFYGVLFGEAREHMTS